MAGDEVVDSLWVRIRGMDDKADLLMGCQGSGFTGLIVRSI